MKFSLLIPTKNRPRMLRTAMKHILNQLYDDFEAIIVDDGQERNEEMFALASTNRHVKYFWRHGSGIASAMNFAIRNSSGNIFNWHNDDDFIAKRTLEFVSKNIGKAEWCYGRIILMNRYRIPIGLMGRKLDYEVEKRQNIIPQPAVFWTRKAFETIGFFDESIDHVTDHDYWLRLGSKFEPSFFNRVFAYYIVHQNMGSKVFYDQKVVQWEQMKQKYKNVTPEYLNVR